MEDLKNKLIVAKGDDFEVYNLNGIETLGKVVEMYDGDTCKIILIINDQLQKINCRLLGLDTPEMKPSLSKLNRDEEIINAHKCKNRLLQLCTNCECKIDIIMKKLECKKILDTNTKIIKVKCHEFDKYGRLLVTLFDDDKSLNQTLIDEKYAKSYDGGTKEQFIY
jgi:endonuclease YncB( thermonuclease family)